MILIADAAWDAIVGVALIAASIASVTRPLGAGPLRPGPVPIALGAVCLAVAALMVHASAGTQAAAACRLIAPGNVVGVLAAIALLIAFPDAAHPYVVALAAGGAGCAVFATLEYQAAGARPTSPASQRS